MSNTETITHEEKIQYMKLASGMCGFGIGIRELDLLVCLYEGVGELKGEFSLRDAAKIEVEVTDRERQRNAKDALDKISKKV
jgi:hypothetical protein